MFAKLADHFALLALQALLPAFPETGQLFLVGGAVRDALRARAPVDFDCTSAGDPTALAKALAGKVRGHWFWLDEPRRQSRVIIGKVTCDFAPWRAATLAGDLAARDFTINAMAIDLADPLTGTALIDPLGGRADLAARILRCAGPGVLLDDPLRILKGIRHAAELDLTIEPATLCAMQAAAVRLPVMAPERLRLEIWRIMATPAPQGLDGLVASGAGEVLFGPGLRAKCPEIRRRLLDGHALFAELSAVTSMVADWLREPVEQGLDRAALLRWHFLLSAIDPGLPLKLARRWRFSRPALGRLSGLGKVVPDLWQDLQSLPSAPRPVALWARQFAPDPVDLLLALGLLLDLEPMTVRESLAHRLRLLAELPDPKQVPPLVAGGWLQTELGITGKMIGAVQAELVAAEIRGDVRDADEARRYLFALHPKNG